MEIRRIGPKEREAAVALILRVFMEFEAPDDSPEGVETFQNTVIYHNGYMDGLVIYGAYEGETLWGVIATRNEGNHIALFFVDGSRHRQGIGRMLFQRVLTNSAANEITVNSSPYAVPVYRRLGFVEAAPEQTTGGMRYVPMIYEKGDGRHRPVKHCQA